MKCTKPSPEAIGARAPNSINAGTNMKGGEMKTEQEIRDEIARIEKINSEQGWILGTELIRVNKAIIKILKWVLNEDSIKVKEG